MTTSKRKVEIYGLGSFSVGKSSVKTRKKGVGDELPMYLREELIHTESTQAGERPGCKHCALGRRREEWN